MYKSNRRLTYMEIGEPKKFHEHVPQPVELPLPAEQPVEQPQPEEVPA
jgi:hypothetical protein